MLFNGVPEKNNIVFLLLGHKCTNSSRDNNTQHKKKSYKRDSKKGDRESHNYLGRSLEMVSSYLSLLTPIIGDVLPFLP